MKRLSRREALKIGALAGGSLLLPTLLPHRSFAKSGVSPKTKPFTLPFRVPPVLQPVKSNDTPGSNGAQNFTGTDYYIITHKPGMQEILPGYVSGVWGYNGIFPGPTIKVPEGRQTVIRHINQLPAGNPTVVHLHGMASLPQYDGYAEDYIPPGYYKDYYYPNDKARTIWYHDHALGKTALNVYRGLAGFYIVQNDLELNLELPKDKYDVPLFLHDKLFSANGSVIYDDLGETHLMGDVITVNGVAWPRMKVARRKYRFRILNGSISRSYRLALSTGEPLIVIGTDAGLRATPVPVKELKIGMAERYEVVIDFSHYKEGTQIVLQNRELPINIDYDDTNVVMRFDVDDSEDDGTLDPPLPGKLGDIEILQEKDAKRTREWRFHRNNGQWVINGKVWNKKRIDAKVNLGDIEIWKIYNNAGGWFHPIHVHLVDQQILDRNGKPPLAYERNCWKDTFYVGPNESLRIIAKYGPHKGKYMMHCHNTVHEDFDMMTQFEVGYGGLDPVATAPAQPIEKMYPF